MKTIILIFICSFAMMTLLSGQESQLILTKKSKGYERYIEPGKKIRVYKSAFHKIKGKLIIIDSSSIAIGNDTMLLADIVSITAISKDSRSAGVMLTTIGGLILVTGIVGLGEISGSSSGSTFGPSEETVIGLVGMFTLIGAAITSVGIGKLVVGTPYKSEKWVFSVRRS